MWTVGQLSNCVFAQSSSPQRSFICFQTVVWDFTERKHRKRFTLTVKVVELHTCQFSHTQRFCLYSRGFTRNFLARTASRWRKLSHVRNPSIVFSADMLQWQIPTQCTLPQSSWLRGGTATFRNLLGHTLPRGSISLGTVFHPWSLA